MRGTLQDGHSYKRNRYQKRFNKMGIKMSKDSNDTKIVSICSNCLITEDTVDFASCGNCKAVKYCSKLCQKYMNH